MIGTLKESSLHATLKQIYRVPGAKIEKPLGKYVIDIVYNNLLIEIQTKNFSAIRKKLENLIQNYRMLLIYPIIQDKWITYLESTNKSVIKKRLSPIHGSLINVFKELVYISDLISNFNLIVEVILIQAEEVRVKNSKGDWRRNGWSIYDQKLIRILDHKIFSNPEQFLIFIPNELKKPFTNQTLSTWLNIPINLARIMTYSLRKMNLLNVVGKLGNRYLFNLNS